MQASCLSSLHSQHHQALCPSAILCCQPSRSCLTLLRAPPCTPLSMSHRLVIVPQILRPNLQLSVALLLQPPPLPPLRSAVRIPLRVASRAPLVRERFDPVHSPMIQFAASQDSVDSPLPVSPPSQPANAIPLHHCSTRLQSLLLEHPHPIGSRLHLAELLRLAAVDSSHVLSQQHFHRVAHILGDCAFARTSSNMVCRFSRSSIAAPTFCTSRVHRTSVFSPIFAPPSTRVAMKLSITAAIAKLSTM